VVATVAAIGAAHPAFGSFGEGRERRGSDGLTGAFEGGCRPVGIDLRLIAEGAQIADPLLQRLVVKVGDAVLDRFVQALEPGIGLGSLPAEFGHQRVNRPGFVGGLNA